MQGKYFLIAVLCICLTGCGSGNQEKFHITTPDTYPLDTQEELTYALIPSEHMTTEVASFNDLAIKEDLVRKTGINVKFIHPYNRDVDYFSMMLVSDDLPDIIEMNWYEYGFGSDKAIKENTIVALDDYIKYVSPNFKEYLEENQDIAESVKTQEGHYYMYPFIRENAMMSTCRGAMIRKDILDKQNVPMPETIEEWETALRALKAGGIEIPLSIDTMLSGGNTINADPLVGAFGITNGLFVTDGKVRLGYAELAYQQYIKLLSRWYKEGLLDPDFQDRSHVSQDVLNHKIGALTGTIGGEFGKWFAILEKTAPDVKFEPVKYVAAKKGERPLFGEKNWRITGVGAAISTKCRNKEIAVRFLDFGYSEEGHMLYNFGREGESYTMENGYPKYTDQILKSESQVNAEYRQGVPQAMNNYMRALYNGPFIQDHRYLEQYYSTELQKKAYWLWNDTNASSHIFPQVKMTMEEANEITNIIPTLQKYRNDILYKLITGKVDLSYMETEYYNTLRSLGVERALEIYQAAYERLKN